MVDMTKAKRERDDSFSLSKPLPKKTKVKRGIEPHTAETIISAASIEDLKAVLQMKAS